MRGAVVAVLCLLAFVACGVGVSMPRDTPRSLPAADLLTSAATPTSAPTPTVTSVLPISTPSATATLPLPTATAVLPTATPRRFPAGPVLASGGAPPR
jgi:hypothetical protein